MPSARQNVQVAGGTVGGPPYDEGVELQLPIMAQGRLSEAEQFDEIIIKRDGGVVTRLKDVARVEVDAATYGLRSLIDNKEAGAIGIFQAPGSNAIEISDAVRARMDELKQFFPEGLDYTIVYDPTVFVRGSIEAVIETLLIAVGLVVLVVILFLQTWRASIIPLLSVPVSIVGTFTFMYLFGFSINALSLFGLVLAIGIVVDDAIVVVENVERSIENGLSPREATIKAMREVTGPIIAIALVLCAVFVPIAFISGLSGQFYRQFALTIAFSTVISAFNSLTLSPALAATLLKAHGAPKDWLTRLMDGLFGGFFRGFNWVFRRAGNGYSRGVRGVLGHKSIAVGIYAVLLGVTYLGFYQVPAGYIPQQDKLYLVSFAQLPDGATLDRTEIGHPPDVGHRAEGRRRRACGGLPRPLDQRLHQQLVGRHRVRHAQALRGAQIARSLRCGDRAEASAEIFRHQGRVRRRLPAAAGDRVGQHRRVQAAGRRPHRSRLCGARRK